MNLRTKIENKINALDEQWRELPLKKQRRYTVYFFLGYIMLTLLVVASLCVGSREEDDHTDIMHIVNPVEPRDSDSISVHLKKDNNGK